MIIPSELVYQKLFLNQTWHKRTIPKPYIWATAEVEVVQNQPPVNATATDAQMEETAQQKVNTTGTVTDSYGKWWDNSWKRSSHR